MTLIAVDNLGKAFCTYKSELHRIGRWFGLAATPVEEHWTLREVNFSVEPGESIGIVGQNGAGKSTLLKIITGTLHPTEGSVQVNGRISAILELGLGFDPELTGRQNVLHSAGLMGFNAADIQRMLPDIEAFAEIGEYFDEPVRTYSSGMQMRVAFSVATMTRPEILIVDEALSVGDSYFQHKSFNRIREFQEQGTTLLIVSHDRNAIHSLCRRAILIDQGTVIKDDTPEVIFDFYNAIIATKEAENIRTIKLDDGKTQTSSGTGEASVERIELFNHKGIAVDNLGVGDPLKLRICVGVHADIDSLVLGYSIKDRLGQIMYGTNTWYTDQVIEQARAGDRYDFSIDFPANLGVGSYSIQTALVDRDTHMSANYEWRDLALVFNVVNINKTTFSGSMWLEPTITLDKVLEKEQP